MATRKSAKVRQKEFELAILRIEHGKARTNPKRGLSISAVADEVGVSSSLIHNHYPDVAKEINEKPGSRRAARLDREQSELDKERSKNADLRQALEDESKRVTQLTTINDMLVTENRELKARLESKNVVAMPRRGR